jgi:hypothetical protein
MTSAAKAEDEKRLMLAFGGGAFGADVARKLFFAMKFLQQ